MTQNSVYDLIIIHSKKFFLYSRAVSWGFCIGEKKYKVWGGGGLQATALYSVVNLNHNVNFSN